MTGAPTLVHVPPGVRGSYRDEVGELMEIAGRPLDPHQLVAVEALTSYTRGGRWPTFVAGVEGPRQTVGKTGGIGLPIALFLCLAFPELADERTWTAHRLDTTGKTFRDAQQLLGVESLDRADWHGQLSTRVKAVGRENGNEHVEFANGAFLWFKARSVRAGRGLSGHDVFADELLFARDDEFGALLPTMATRSLHGMPRLWTMSSSAKAESHFLRRQRARAEKGDAGVVYVGWWADGSWRDPGCRADPCMHAAGTPGCRLDDRRLWRQANPLTRTSEAFLEEMRGTLSPVEFGREFLGWQEDPETPTAVNLERWAELADPASRPQPWPVALAFDVSPGLRSAAVVAAGLREDGLPHVELLAYRPGVAWLGEFLADRQERTGAAAYRLGGRAPAAAVTLPDGLAVEEMSEVEYTAACGALDRAVEDAALRHLGDPLVAAALRAAARKDVGDGSFVLSRKASAGDICPAVALVVALRALRTDRSGEVWGFAE